MLYSVISDCGCAKPLKSVLNYKCSWKVRYMIALMSGGANRRKLSMSN